MMRSKIHRARVTDHERLLVVAPAAAHPLVELSWYSVSENVTFVAGAWTIFSLLPEKGATRALRGHARRLGRASPPPLGARGLTLTTLPSAPSRAKSGFGAILTVIRTSPLRPPGPASPCPLSRILDPLSTPGGTLTSTFRRRRTSPLPRQVGHGSVGI